jgi:hypothetical protein
VEEVSLHISWPEAVLERVAEDIRKARNDRQSLGGDPVAQLSRKYSASVNLEKGSASVKAKPSTTVVYADVSTLMMTACYEEHDATG